MVSRAPGWGNSLIPSSEDVNLLLLPNIRQSQKTAVADGLDKTSAPHIDHCKILWQPPGSRSAQRNRTAGMRVLTPMNPLLSQMKGTCTLPGSMSLPAPRPGSSPSLGTNRTLNGTSKS